MGNIQSKKSDDNNFTYVECMCNKFNLHIELEPSEKVGFIDYMNTNLAAYSKYGDSTELRRLYSNIQTIDIPNLSHSHMVYMDYLSKIINDCIIYVYNISTSSVIPLSSYDLMYYAVMYLSEYITRNDSKIIKIKHQTTLELIKNSHIVLVYPTWNHVRRATFLYNLDKKYVNYIRSEIAVFDALGDMFAVLKNHIVCVQYENMENPKILSCYGKKLRCTKYLTNYFIV